MKLPLAKNPPVQFSFARGRREEESKGVSRGGRGRGINLIFFSFYLAIAYPCRSALLHPSGDEEESCVHTRPTFSPFLDVASALLCFCASLPIATFQEVATVAEENNALHVRIWPIEREKKGLSRSPLLESHFGLLRLLVMDDRGRRNRGGGGGGPFLPFDTNSSTMGRCTDTKRARGEKKETRGEDQIVRERSRVLLQ